jgi:hypothetical protein
MSAAAVSTSVMGSAATMKIVDDDLVADRRVGAAGRVGGITVPSSV